MNGIIINDIYYKAIELENSDCPQCDLEEFCDNHTLEYEHNFCSCFTLVAGKPVIFKKLEIPQ